MYAISQMNYEALQAEPYGYMPIYKWYNLIMKTFHNIYTEGNILMSTYLSSKATLRNIGIWSSEFNYR